MNVKRIIIFCAILFSLFPLSAEGTDGDVSSAGIQAPPDGIVNSPPETQNSGIEKTDAENNDSVSGSSLFGTVRQGGPMMVFIVLLGLAGLTIIIERIIFFIRTSAWKKESLRRQMLSVAKSSSALYREQLDDELRENLRLYVSRLEKGMPLLNGIGNISPILGFLGTVIGMIAAFSAIASATTVNAKVVAVGIQVALVTTAGGLMVAAPLLAAYHFFNHIIHSLISDAEEYIAGLMRTVDLPSILADDDKKGQAQ